MYLIYLLFTIVKLFLLEISIAPSQEKFSGEVKHLFTISSSNKETQFRAYDLYVSPQGHIYISDQIEDCIKIFNQEGKFIKKYGKNGNKPGEFNTIGELSVSENYIAVSDYRSSRLQLFSKDFKHIQTIYVQGSIFDLAFDSDEFLWVAASTGKKNKTLFKYSKGSNKIDQLIPLKYASGDEFKDIFSLSISKNGFVVVAYRVINRIEIWDKSGNFIKDFQIPGLKSEADYKRIQTGLFSSRKVPDGFIIGFCCINDNGHIFLNSGNYSENPLQDLYVMNTKGEFLAKILIPDKMWKISVQNNRNVILISGKGLDNVKKYLIK